MPGVGFGFETPDAAVTYCATPSRRRQGGTLCLLGLARSVVVRGGRGEKVWTKRRRPWFRKMVLKFKLRLPPHPFCAEPDMVLGQPKGRLVRRSGQIRLELGP